MRRNDIYIAAAIWLFLAALMTSCSTPTQQEIDAAYQKAYSLPEGPERDKAIIEAAKLEAKKEAVDSAVETAGHVADYLVPGLGALVAFGYGAWQRYQNKKSKTMLAATMSAIEEYKESNMGEAAEILMKKLSDAHDKAGVRDAIRAALADLRKDKGK